MNIVQITDIADSRVEEFFSLRDKKLKDKDLIIAESKKVVNKLLKSDITVKKIFATNEYIEENKDLLTPKIEIYSAKKDIMEQIVGHNLHHGVMALADRPKEVSLNDLEDKILIFNGLSSPENIGTMIRNCTAFNINSVIVDKKTCSPYVRRCIRVSMGNIFKAKIHTATNLAETIEELKSKGYEVCSTANQPGAIDLPEFKFSQKAAVIIGSEGHGIEKEVLEASSKVLRIPINDEVAHLNAACSSAIFLYKLSL